MYIIDIEMKKAVALEKKSFSELNLTERYDLQEWIVDNPSILGENLLIIQKEFGGFHDTNERLDLLALDESGRIVVIENKRDDSGRDVIWQSLKYASYCATLTKNEIFEIYQRFLGLSGDAYERISEFFDGKDYKDIRLNPSNIDQRIILVAANFRKEVTSTVLWLRDHGIDITCIKVTPYKDSEKLYLDVEQILPIQDAGDYQIRLTAKKQEESYLSKEDAVKSKLYNRFWEAALPTLRSKVDIYGSVKQIEKHWQGIEVKPKGCWFGLFIYKNAARVELRINSGDKEFNKRIFHSLSLKKDDFAPSFGTALDWQELPDNILSRIAVQYKVYGLVDEENWNEIIDFFAENLAKFVETFGPMLDSVSKE